MLLFITRIEIGGNESRKRQQAKKGDGGWEKHKRVRECGRKRKKLTTLSTAFERHLQEFNTHRRVLAVTASQDLVFASQKHNFLFYSSQYTPYPVYHGDTTKALVCLYSYVTRTAEPSNLETCCL